MKNIKKINIIFLLSIMAAKTIAQSNTYYYLNKSKIALLTNLKKKYVVADSSFFINENKKNSQFNNLSILHDKMHNKSKIYNFRKNSKMSFTINTQIYNSNNENKKNSILYNSPIYTDIEGNEKIALHLFNVKLYKLSDSIILKQIAIENNIEILEQNEYMPLWFTLACNKNTKGNVLEMANKLYETKLFDVSEPNFITSRTPDCLNDSRFNLQWGLNNTGQALGGFTVPTSGIDIKMCEAWKITTGSNTVSVAIYDSGVETGLPDLTNFTSANYDVISGANKATVYNSASQAVRAHGTNTAGIIGATSNNSIGVSGIAPLCPLMRISINYEAINITANQSANAINYAVNNGASVINCSFSSSVSTIETNAIENAINNGRNGLGAIVVYSSGNQNSTTTNALGSSNQNILLVGGINQCGKRFATGQCGLTANGTYGSNYSTNLDVMAPGVYIPTVDRIGTNSVDNDNDGYTNLYSGTSAAAPHVAGLAALIISHRPQLTGQQVRDIIERTCQKVGGYTYSTTIGRPNGTWNSEMGYGLINAHAALLEAEIVACPTTTNLNGLNYNTGALSTTNACRIKVSNTIIQNNSKVILDHIDYTEINGDFEVKLGSELEIK